MIFVWLNASPELPASAIAFTTVERLCLAVKLLPIKRTFSVFFSASAFATNEIERSTKNTSCWMVRVMVG